MTTTGPNQESPGSVSRWIGEVKAGDEVAVQCLWERYFDRLLRLCRRRLPDAARRAADEEDVVLSVFESFCRGARQGHFPKLGDRDNLWHLLVLMTARKAMNLVRDELTRKRGSGRVQGESALDEPLSGPRGIEQMVGDEPTPEFAAMVAEECQRRLSRLDDDTLRHVARRKLEGYSNEEIADQLDCSVRTVGRKLWRIRIIWSEEDSEGA
ncbi:MAG: RNA polymerase subunit sigma-70 [Pirellulaceae bacterium]|nr:RNA polymerase subunit sigma-70 [Pirellulaceae bacterium]